MSLKIYKSVYVKNLFNQKYEGRNYTNFIFFSLLSTKYGYKKIKLTRKSNIKVVFTYRGVRFKYPPLEPISALNKGGI